MQAAAAAGVNQNNGQQNTPARTGKKGKGNTQQLNHPVVTTTSSTTTTALSDVASTAIRVPTPTHLQTSLSSPTDLTRSVTLQPQLSHLAMANETYEKLNRYTQVLVAHLNQVENFEVTTAEPASTLVQAAQNLESLLEVIPSFAKYEVQFLKDFYKSFLILSNIKPKTEEEIAEDQMAFKTEFVSSLEKKFANLVNNGPTFEARAKFSLFKENLEGINDKIKELLGKIKPVITGFDPTLASTQMKEYIKQLRIASNSLHKFAFKTLKITQCVNMALDFFPEVTSLTQQIKTLEESLRSLKHECIGNADKGLVKLPKNNPKWETLEKNFHDARILSLRYEEKALELEKKFMAFYNELLEIEFLDECSEKFEASCTLLKTTRAQTVHHLNTILEELVQKGGGDFKTEADLLLQDAGTATEYRALNLTRYTDAKLLEYRKKACVTICQERVPVYEAHQEQIRNYLSWVKEHICKNLASKFIATSNGEEKKIANDMIIIFNDVHEKFSNPLIEIANGRFGDLYAEAIALRDTLDHVGHTFGQGREPMYKRTVGLEQTPFIGSILSLGQSLTSWAGMTSAPAPVDEYGMTALAQCSFPIIPTIPELKKPEDGIKA